MRDRRDSAVSTVVGAILVLMTVTVAITTVLIWIVPYIERTKAETQINNVYSQFSVLDEVLSDLISQGANASTVSNVAIDKGGINIDSGGDRIVIFYSLDPSFNFTVSDFDDDDNKFNFTITKCATGITSYKINISYLATNDFDDNPRFYPCPPVEGRTVTVICDKDLVDAVKIDITPGGVAEVKHIVLGRIWLFDTGSISYSLPSSSGTYGVITENMGIVLVYPGSSYLKEEPVVFNKSNAFVLQVLQVKPVGSSGGVGAGTAGLATATPGMGGGISSSQIIPIFFYAALIQGFGSGLVAGVFEEGNLPAGIKHAFIIVLVTWLTFKSIIGI